MAQNRKPPAYQEYAATMIATREYRLLSLPARGLLYSMRLECWVNSGLPSSPSELAKLLGFSEQEVRASLTDVMYFFAIKGDSLVCPELENYREHLDQWRAKQVDGGKKGAAIANRNRNKMPQDEAEVSRGSTTGFLVKSNKVKSNTNSVNNEDFPESAKKWLEDYDSTK